MLQLHSERSSTRKFLSQAKTVCLSLIFTLALFIQAGAQNFTVNNNGDTHATTPASSPLDGSGNITLRSAMEAATAQAGPHIITIPASITAISLTLGNMNVGSATSSNITVNGPGMNILTVTQTTAARIFSTTTQPNFTFLLQDMTLTYAGPATTFAGGGGALLAGGTGAVTTVNRCKVTNWKNQVGNGGAIAVTFSSVSHNFNMADCVFDNNKCGGGGGAVAYSGLGTVVITRCTFTNNNTGVVGANTGGSGAALNLTGQAPGGTYSVTECTFLNNTVENATSQGGAVMHVNGQLTLNYNRFVGNVALGGGSVLYQSGGDAANTVNANNNWWGHNTAPTAAEVGNGPAPVTVPVAAKWLQLKLSASPTTICATTSPTTSLVTASFLSNSAGEAIAVGNLDALIGLPITYSATLGTLSGAQNTIQATGTATVTFTSNGTAGTGTVNGVVDNVPSNDPTARASITVNIVPSIGTQPTNQTTCAGSTTTFSVTASGTPTPGYQWRKGTTNLSNGATGNGSTISGATTNTLTITTTALADAAADYNVVITNSCGSVTSNNVSLTVKALPVVTAPTVTQPTCTTPTGTIVVNATGASGTIEYSINNGGAYQASATFSGLAPSSTHNIVVRYTAAPNCPVAYASNPVTINAVPLAPTVNNPATTTGTVGTAFSQTFTTTGGLAPITFATTSTLPTGLTLSSAGVLSGTPTQSGTFPIVVKATDANGCVGTGTTYNLVISCQTITVTNPATATGTVGTAFSQTFTQTGALGGATFTTTSTLPNGLTLSAAGVLSGTPTQSGTFPIVVKVTDGNGCSANGPTYTLVISCQTITVTNPVNATGQLSIPFSETFTQTGGIGTTTFSTTSTLPTGITLSSAGVLSGTPTQTGTFPIVVKATDANGCTGNGPTYTLVINACPVITVTNPSNASGTVGTAFSESFANATGGQSPYTYSTTSTLPTGLTLSSAGVLSGTPTQSGTFPIVVKATDANLCAGNSPTYTLVIGCPAVSVNAVGNQVVCNGASTTAVSFSGSPAGTVFNWTNNAPSIGLAASGSGNIASFTATNATNAPVVATITVTPTYGVNCNGTPTTFTITVNPTATVTTVPNQGVCNGAATTAVTFSSPTTGGTIVYNWTNNTTSIGLTASGSGNIASFTATNATAAAIVATITVTPTYTNSAVTCVGTPSTFTITVNPTPTVNTVSNQTVCNGAPTTVINFSGAVTGTVYNWTNNTTSIGLAASGSGDIGAFIGTNGTNAPVTATITVTPSYTNAGATCTGTPTTFTITVNPSNTVAQVGPQTVCNGANTTAITFSSTATGGTVVYNWTGTDGTIGLPTSGSGNIASFTAINTGTTVVTDTIKVTAAYTNGGTTCNSAVMLFVITVNPTPDVNTVANQTVCTGAPTAAVNFTGAVPGTVYQWTNNTTSIGLGASGTGNIPSFTATNATASPVTATVTVTPVFYNQSIQGSIVSGDLTMPNRLFRDGIPSTCANKAFPGTSAGAHLYDQYSFVNTTGQAQCVTLSYAAKSTGDVFVAAYNGSFNPAALATNYLGDGGLSSIAGSVSTFSVTVAAGGTLVVIALEANSAPCPLYVLSVSGIGMSCTGTPKTFTITVNPTPTVNAVTNQTVCNGAATTAVNFSGATTGTVYNWTNNTPSIGLAASGSGNIASFTATNATTAPVTATITVTPSYTNAGTTCTGTPTTFTITVNPTATVNAVSNQSVCNTQSTTSITFSSPTTGGTIVYNWTNNTPSIGLAASGSGNIASFTAVNTGTVPVVATITVTPAYTNGSVTCNGTPITFTITVNPPPATTCPGNINVNAAAGSCSAVVTYTATGSGTITYTFTGATLGSGSGTGSGSAFNVGVTTVTITSTSSCGNSNCSFTVTVNDIEPPVITCPAQIVVCGSQVVNYPLPTVTDNCTVSAPLNITQTASNSITPSNSVSCNNGAGHTANGYWRVYDLGAMGLAGPYTVNKVIFGVESANAPSGSQPATVRVYTLTGAFTIANLTQVASENITITNQSGTLITVNLTSPPTVAANAKLVLEVFTPDGRPSSNLFYMGSNTGAQTAPNYISAPDCGVVNPIDVSSVGYPNMRSVLNAEGTVGGSITPVQTAGLPSGSVFPVGTTVNTYTATDGSGNTSSCSFNVIVNPVPSVNAVSNQTVCNNDATAAVTFSGPVSGTVFNWTNNTTSIGLAASGTGNIASFTAVNLTSAAVTATITVTPSYTANALTCTGTPITFTITVNPRPNVDPVANQVVCNGAPTAAVTFTGATAGTVFNWTNNTPSIGLAASGTGNIASFTATNTTNAPVVATITVTPTLTAGVTCPGTPRTFTITVNPTPVVNTVANQTVCNGAPTAAVTFSSPTTGGTIVYNWTNNNTTIGLAASGAGNIASFTATNASTVPVTATVTVTPSYTNAAVTCTGTPITFTITVNPTPTVNPVANQTVCNGAPTTAVTFSGLVTGTVFNWTNNTTSIGLAASGTGNIASFTGTNTTNAPVTATITVTPSYTNNGTTCTGTARTFTITVNPTPTVNTVANQVVCNGAPTAAITFSGFVPGTVYSWSNNNTSIGLTGSGTGNIASFTATNTTNAPVTATITVTPSYTNNGVTCTGTATTFTITVNPTPTVNTVANQVLCNGSPTTAIAFTGFVPGTVYSWTNTTTSIGLAASGTGDIASFTATNTTNAPVVATITVTPSYTNGGTTCTGSSKTFTITVNPTPTVNSVANQVVCNGAPTTAVTFSGFVPGTVYSWTNNTTSIGLAASGTGNIASFTATNVTNAPVVATITVTPSYTNGGVTCTGASTTFTITVNPTPTVNTVPDQTVCNNGTTTDVNFTGFVPGTVYSWTNSATSIGLAASGTGDIPSFTATNSGTAPVIATIVVTPSYTNAGVTCTGATMTFTITVNPTPTINPVANQVVCNNSPTAAINFTSPTTGGTIVYNWSNTTTSIGLASSGSGNIASFNAINNGTTPVTATITVIPSYTNNGVTCTGPSISFDITVNPTPNVNPVADQAVCNGAGSTPVTFTGATPGTVYNWTNSNTAIGLAASGTGNIPSFTGTNAGTAPISGTITVTPTYTNGGTTCSGAAITFIITINPTPTVNAIANQVVCNNSPTTAVTFTGAVTGTVYNWTNNTTSIGLAASGTGNIASFTATNATNAPVTATITVTPTYTNGGTTCSGTPRTFTITVNPTPTVAAVANQVVCNGATTSVTFTGAVTGTVFNWTNNTTSIGLAASGTGNIPTFTAVNAGTAPVVATIVVTPSYTNGSVTCTGTPVTFTITVNPTTVITTQPANVTLCASGTATFTVVATGTALTYQWQLNTGSGFANIPGAMGASYSTTATAAMTGYQYRVIVTGTCGTLTSNAATLTVNTPPAITSQPVNTAGCIGGSATFNVTATGTALTYQWQRNTGSGFVDIPLATSASYTQTGITAAMAGYQYRVIVSGTCTPSQTSNAVTLTVNTPVTITAQPASVTICFGIGATFTVTATGTALTYQWQVNTGSGFVNLPGETSPTLTITAPPVIFSSNQYRVIVTGACGSVISNTATLIIFNLPSIDLSRVPPRVCLTDTVVTLQALPAGGTWTGRGVSSGNKFSARAAGAGVSTLTYTVTNLNGCISTRDYNITVNDCIERHNRLQNGVKIFPNPSSGKFFVRFLTDNYTEVNMRIVDGSGRELKAMRFTGLTYGMNIPIDARGLASGTYFLQVYNGGDRATFPIVIAH